MTRPARRRPVGPRARRAPAALAPIAAAIGLVVTAGVFTGRVAHAETFAAQLVEPNPNFRSWRIQPAAINAAAGDTIVWTNAGGAAHTVTAKDRVFDSGNLAPGATFSWKPKFGGTYTYFCTYHPWMTGSITVAGPPAPAAGAAAGAGLGPSLLLLLGALAIAGVASLPFGAGVLLVGWLIYDAHNHRRA